jgi:hypothetical protein
MIGARDASSPMGSTRASVVILAVIATGTAARPAAARAGREAGVVIAEPGAESPLVELVADLTPIGRGRSSGCTWCST